MLEMIYIPVLILSLTGLLLGIGITVVSKFFEVKSDERIADARGVLPGINCGACGFSGCDAFADAVVTGKAQTNGCPVGGEETAKLLSGIMGVKECNVESIVARVDCGGTIGNCGYKQDYHGMESCASAQHLYGGIRICNYGCIGLGDCVRACPFDAIKIKDSLAVILEDKCRGCKKCIAACPKAIIEMVPQIKRYSVACRNREKGAVSMKQCSVSCIGCTKCVKVCPAEAIKMDDFLAKIDCDKCINCGKCKEVCPTNAIDEYPGR
jgi:Na+-translocating ferredoxin:NAD+ oxidoreductase subunit B